MSKISKIPETWIYREILYKINIYKENWKLKVELDSEWNIKTNINRLIDKIIDYDKEWKVIKIDHDLYHRINNWIDSLTNVIEEDIKLILNNLYYRNKKVA